MLENILKFLSSLQNSAPPVVNANKNHITCKIYSVKGKNPKTNRTKTEKVIAFSTDSQDEIQKKSGLLPPYEINEVSESKPSDRQVEYAKKLGFSFPEDATLSDASIFLTRKENNKPLIQPRTPDKFLKYIIEKGIYIPAYADKNLAFDLYFNNVELHERIAFFGMRVYCNLKRKKYSLLEDATENERNLFFEFAEYYKDNKDFLTSLSYYSGSDFPLDSHTVSKKLKAYDMAVDYFVK